MRKVCASCGGEFEAKRAAAKYCGERCKKRAQRKPGGVRAADASAPAAPPARVGFGPVGEATAAELERAGRLETAAGRAVLALAGRIDAAHMETGTALAALVREHRAALAEAVRDAEVAADPLDELRARRERKSAGG